MRLVSGICMTRTWSQDSLPTPHNSGALSSCFSEVTASSLVVWLLLCRSATLGLPVLSKVLSGCILAEVGV